jgi:hypothetical protein
MSDEKTRLIDFSSIEKNLEHVHQLNKGVQAIPIDKIVGSLGRYNDFTEGFLPNTAGISAKYEAVKKAMLAGKILPPIKVYQILDNYFVVDGHHRITVAKNELQAKEIDADVTEIHFDLELEPDKKYSYDTARAKEFLIRLQEEVFQKETFLRNALLVHPLKVTDLTSYAKLYEEIKDFRHSYDDGTLAKRSIIYASYLWYELRFLPAVTVILDEHLLDGFHNRTYTDLYVWIQQHKYFLSLTAGYDVGFDFTKDDFIQKFRQSKFLDILPPVFRDIAKKIKERTVSLRPLKGI